MKGGLGFPEIKATSGGGVHALYAGRRSPRVNSFTRGTV